MPRLYRNKQNSCIYIKRDYVDKRFLILESDNDDYLPVTLPLDDVHEVYYAIQRITRNSRPRPDHVTPGQSGGVFSQAVPRIHLNPRKTISQFFEATFM